MTGELSFTEWLTMTADGILFMLVVTLLAAFVLTTAYNRLVGSSNE